MFPSNPCFVLALLAVSFFGNFLVSVDGKCAIEPVDGHVNWPKKKKKINKNAFKKCKELVTICIPPEVESIHNTAFVKSGLDLTKLYEVPCEKGSTDITDVPTMAPPSPPAELVNIPETAVAFGFTTLVTALMVSDLVEPLSNPPNAGPFTVFAPTNQAFDLLGDTLLGCLLLPRYERVLKNIASYHVLVNELLLAEDLSDSQVFLMLNGERIVTYIGVDGTVTINDNSVIETADVMATNGVIHAIDRVLVPPALNIAEFLETCAIEAPTNTSTSSPTGTPRPSISSPPTLHPTTDQNFEWTSQISATNNKWRSVTYGKGIFVAVGTSWTDNRVITSPDGIKWTSRVAAANNSWLGVTYGNGIFVAVSSTGTRGETNNRVMTSPDGIEWTSQTSATYNYWSCVTYGNGIFVAVSATGIGKGIGNRVMTSPDGIKWTSRVSAADNPWNSVTYGNGTFVAVSWSGTGNHVMTSPDGIKWTSRTSAADNYWRSVTYGDGIFVAVSYSGTGDRVMTSPDGIEWTSQTSAADNDWMSVTYGDGLFVAVGYSWSGAGNLVMTSPDGIEWTSRASATDNSWYGVTYGKGIFVAVSSTGTGNRVMTWAP